MTQSTQRPNIVFIFADDWGRYANAYAKFEGPDSINALIETPNFVFILGAVLNAIGMFSSYTAFKPDK